MADLSASMTVARASIVALRLQGLTLTALVERKILEPNEAASLVEDAASYLSAPNNSPEVEQLYRDTLEQIAKQLRSHRRG